jgi:integrase
VRSLWRTIIADAPFYREPLDALTQAEVEEWVAALPKKRCKRSVLRDGKRVTEEMDRTLSPQMIKHALRKLQLCLDAAKKKGIVRENVARGLELPERDRIEDSWTHLERSESESVFKLELTEEQRAVFSVAIYQGLRVGEIAALTWECLRLEGDAPRVEVRRSWNGSTKTGKPRTVPLMPAAREALARWQKISGRKAGLVFPSPSRAVYSREHRWGWDERRSGPDTPTRAGIARRVPFHALRHTCASMLVSGEWGAPGRSRRSARSWATARSR